MNSVGCPADRLSGLVRGGDSSKSRGHRPGWPTAGTVLFAGAGVDGGKQRAICGLQAWSCPICSTTGRGERRFGDLIRIDNDGSFGTWINLSEGSQGWQPDLVPVEQPLPGAHRIFGDLSGRRTDRPSTATPCSWSSFADAERETDGRQPVHGGRRSDDRHRWPASTPSGTTHSLLPEHRGIGPAQGRTGRQARLQQQPRLRLRSLEPRPRALDRSAARRAAGRWPCSTGRTVPAPRTKSIDFADTLGLAGPAAAPGPVGPPGPGVDDQLPRSTWAPHASVLLLVVPARSGPLSGRGRGLGGIGPVRGHLRRPPKGWATSPGSTPKGAAWPWPCRCTVPVVAGSCLPRGQRHRQPVEAERSGRSTRRPAPSTARPPSSVASTPDLDLVADGAGQADHGGRSTDWVVPLRWPGRRDDLDSWPSARCRRQPVADSGWDSFTPLRRPGRRREAEPGGSCRGGQPIRPAVSPPPAASHPRGSGRAFQRVGGRPGRLVGYQAVPLQVAPDGHQSLVRGVTPSISPLQLTEPLGPPTSTWTTYGSTCRRSSRAPLGLRRRLASPSGVPIGGPTSWRK